MLHMITKCSLLPPFGEMRLSLLQLTLVILVVFDCSYYSSSNWLNHHYHPSSTSCTISCCDAAFVITDVSRIVPIHQRRQNARIAPATSTNNILQTHQRQQQQQQLYVCLSCWHQGIRPRRSTIRSKSSIRSSSRRRNDCHLRCANNNDNNLNTDTDDRELLFNFDSDDATTIINSMQRNSNHTTTTTQTTTTEIVEELRRRASLLRQEVQELEHSIQQQKQSKIQKTQITIQNMIQQLFIIGIVPPPPVVAGTVIAAAAATATATAATSTATTTTNRTASSVADVIRREQYSEQQLLDLLQFLYQERNNNSHRLSSSSSAGVATAVVPAVSASAVSSSTKETYVLTSITSVTDPSTATSNGMSSSSSSIVAPTESVDLMGQYMQLLLDATVLIDQDTTGAGTVTRIDDRRPTLTSLSGRWSTSSSSSSSSKQQQLSSILQSKLQEWSRNDEMNIRRQMDAMFRTKLKQQLKDETNATAFGEAHVPSTNTGASAGTIIYIPRWIPPSLYKSISLFSLSSSLPTSSTTAPTTTKTTNGPAATTGKLDPLDVLAIKERVLSKTRFFCTSSETFLNMAAIFRGNIRSSPSTSTSSTGSSMSNNAATKTRNNPNKLVEIVFHEIQSSMEREGLANTTQLFLLNDPDWRPNNNNNNNNNNIDIRDIQSQPKPILVALPKTFTPYDNHIVPSRRTKFLRELSPTIATLTTFLYAIECFALNPVVFDGIVRKQNVSVLSKCIPFTLMLLVIQFCHEMAHFVVAQKRNIKIGFPILIPSFKLGIFGCITKIKSFPSSRSSLFDFALSGPLVGTFLSLCCMIVGCYKTVHAPLTVLMTYPTIPLMTFKSSFLTGSMLTFLLPKTILMPLSHPIPLHPLFVAGYTSLIVSALNLLPIFQLDGGRACTAVLGTRFGVLISTWTMLSLLSLCLSGSNVAWTWGTFILLFQRQQEITCRDDVTPVGKSRTIIWCASLLIALLTLLPFPGGSFL